jgi:CelD/BcsL family acetyltransferase involved in cellulose biosynthesis
MRLPSAELNLISIYPRSFAAKLPGPGYVHEIQPLLDTRWDQFVKKQAGSSVFHTTAWLDALYRTYGYRPVVYTDAPPGCELASGVPFCHVDSWLTGRRLVSVPFSDHCDPLVSDTADLAELCSRLIGGDGSKRPGYVEIRPVRALQNPAEPWESTSRYCLHILDLSPDLATLFRNCHKDSTQRKVRRAERERLTCEFGRSEALLSAFYSLLILTRRRHEIPPQPLAWFRNLIDCFGEALTIRVASKNGQPVAAILTLRHKETLVYKYGCSDERLSNLGGTHLLFWHTIEEAKAENILRFDLGRSDIANEGLITFKNRWGAVAQSLVYSRLSRSVRPPANSVTSMGNWARDFGKRILPHLPDTIFTTVGKALYRHIG